MTKTCSIPNCEWKVEARGMCIKHYQRWKLGYSGDKLNSPVIGVKPGQEGNCTIAKCQNPVRRHAMCDAHYRRWLKGDRGEVLERPLHGPGKNTCILCGKPVVGFGYCATHYRRLKRGTPLDGVKPKPVKVVPEKPAKRTKLPRYANLDRLIEYKGGKCHRCGISFHRSVYDFHHISPESKVDSVKNMIAYFGLSTETMAEADKCILLCVNCHRIEHFANEWEETEAKLIEHDVISFSPPVCKFDNCDRLAVALGYCDFHWSQQHRGESLSEKPSRNCERKTVGECSVVSCTRAAKTRGMCGAHYKRWLKNDGDISPDTPIKGSGVVCKVYGCNRPVRAGGYCNAHYIRVKDGKDLTAPIANRYAGAKCIVVGCDNEINGKGAHGYCSSHYKSYVRRDFWETVIEKKGGVCQRCGRAYHAVVFDLHHRDKSQKSFTVSVGIGRLSKGKLMDEAEKCDLLCANCHRMEHFDGSNL